MTAWAEVRDLLELQLAPLGRCALTALAPRAGESIVDIGCGGGTTALELARAVAPDGTVIATASSSSIKHGWLTPSSPEIPLHACSLAIETLLVTGSHRRIRKCGASDCDVYFIDTSKAHRRQWCSMQNCGNREKQRRWRSGAE